MSVDYAYDELSRLKDVTDNRQAENNGTSYAYDNVGTLESSSYMYSTLNRLTNLSISKATSQTNGYTCTPGAAGNRESAACLPSPSPCSLASASKSRCKNQAVCLLAGDYRSHLFRRVS